MKQGAVNIWLNSFSFVRRNFDFTPPRAKYLKPIIYTKTSLLRFYIS